MAIVIQNSKISANIYKLRVLCADTVKAGQFYMLRSWGSNPVFSRPLSVSDADGNEVVFVYEVRGKGTKLFSSLKTGDEINMLGPLGNGYELSDKKCVLIGGGVGIAPLVYLAKQLKESKAEITVYLGYRDEIFLEKEMRQYADRMVVNTGGFITDYINEFDAENVYVCGPEIMMKKCYELYKYTNADIYVSLERRMACGIGACLGCNITTKYGNKKVCSDGPVFNAKDVFYE